MLTGVARVLLAFAGMAIMFAFWALVLPACVMLVTLYICRLIPLTGWRQRPEFGHLRTQAGHRKDLKQC
jgi:hypothetical protein